MATLTPQLPYPIEIKLHQQSRMLEIHFSDNQHFTLPCELLRVYSPSAEVQGHGNAILQAGKKFVNVTEISPVGNYAVRLTFSDGHRTGLYSWDYLYRLGKNQTKLWQEYIDKLKVANTSRE